MAEKPWGGRFSKPADTGAESFTASLPYDRRLAEEDLAGSIAHARMLAGCGIIDSEEARLIVKGLEEIGAEIRSGCFPFDTALEDIHMNIEQRLIDKIGPAGGKLHTARSRNDQVALDMHLYMKKEIPLLAGRVGDLQEALLEGAVKYRDVILPGYTHLQRAQPVLLAHHWLAYFWMLQRDRERLAGAYRRADYCPLGAGALAGTGFPIDRRRVAAELGFSRLYENSMDAVADRDYLLEFLGSAAILMMHISRLSEELVLWTSQEFAFIELDDAYTTGSSMMPQKKNPDLAELGRAKTGRVYGHLLALLTTLKGLPLTYNRDLQEDKEGVFDTIDTLHRLLPLYSAMIRTARINRARMAAAAEADFAAATDLADYLAQQGIPFRQAHRIVGQIVAWCLEQGLLLKELNAETLARFHPALDEQARELLDPRRVVEARRSYGGTAPAAVEVQIAEARSALKESLGFPGIHL